MELIIAMAVAAYVVRHGAELVAAITGKQTDWQKAQAHRVEARTAARAARAARAGQKPPKKRSAFREYLGLLWEDGWTDAKSKHSVRRSRRLARQDGQPSSSGSARGFLRQVGRDGWALWDRKWDEATERRASRTRPYEPSPNVQVVPGETVPTPEPQSSPEPSPEPVPVPDQDEDDSPTTEDPTPTTNPEPATSEVPETPEPAVTTERNPTTMTTTATPVIEVPGLDASIKYCADAGTHVATVNTGIEAVKAQLQVNEVTDPDVFAALASASDQLTAAAASFARAKAALSKQITVKDAYDANKGAGSKQFVTAG